jgi:AcrR family transcriptional regulator
MSTAQVADRPTRRRGPKQPGADVREALLSAGGALTAERGNADWSLAEAADRAGVTPAMVGYYFTNKRGFLAALLETGFQPVLARLEWEAGQAEAPDLEELARDLLQTISDRPWLPTLMLHGVIAGDTVRGEFTTRYGPRIAAAGQHLIASAASQGRLRRDLDPRLGFLSALATMVFPFLARPIVEQVLGLRLDGDFAEAQAAHIAKLFTP